LQLFHTHSSTQNPNKLNGASTNKSQKGTTFRAGRKQETLIEREDTEVAKITVAGQAGKPFILASTRSPTFHCCRAAAAAAAAALPPFFRLGAIDKRTKTLILGTRAWIHGNRRVFGGRSLVVVRWGEGKMRTRGMAQG